MTLEPQTVTELQSALATASSERRKIEQVDLRAINQLLAYAPEDMTATVQTGMMLEDLQSRLRQHGQWLPIDPPLGEKLTLEEIISFNHSGPQRLGFGTIRDHLLALTAVLGDGMKISAGAKVVKNVAGFDLPKLFIGARGSLGVVVEATFKLLPLPESELFFFQQFSSAADARTTLAAISTARLQPVSLDLLSVGNKIKLVARFSGAREEVAFQSEQAQAIGLASSPPSNENLFWSNPAAHAKVSVLPTNLIEILEKLDATEFVARAGNGIIYYRGGKSAVREPQAGELMRKLKTAYDPSGILPAYVP